MNEREAGQLFERVEHVAVAVEALTNEIRKVGLLAVHVEGLTTNVEALTKDVRNLREAHAYGKGMLAGLLMVAGAAGAALVHVIEWLKVSLK